MIIELLIPSPTSVIINGQRRHILVDVLGLIIFVSVTGAGIQERNEAKKMITAIKDRMPRFNLYGKTEDTQVL